MSLCMLPNSECDSRRSNDPLPQHLYKTGSGSSCPADRRGADSMREDDSRRTGCQAQRIRKGDSEQRREVSLPRGLALRLRFIPEHAHDSGRWTTRPRRSVDGQLQQRAARLHRRGARQRRDDLLRHSSYDGRDDARRRQNARAARARAQAPLGWPDRGSLALGPLPVGHRSPVRSGLHPFLADLSKKAKSLALTPISRLSIRWPQLADVRWRPPQREGSPMLTGAWRSRSRRQPSRPGRRPASWRTTAAERLPDRSADAHVVPA